MDGLAIALDIGLIVGVGGLLNLDRRAAFQVMVSQPIVALPLLGLLFGQLQTAVWIGAVLQLLWMPGYLVGANVPPNETLASLAIGGVLLLYGAHFGEVDPATMAIGVLLCAPLAQIGRWVEVQLDHSNQALADRALEGHSVERLPLIGLAKTFYAAALLLLPAVGIGLAALALIRPAITGGLEKAFEFLGVYVIPSLALASALSTVRRRRALALGLTAFAVLVVALDLEVPA